MAVAICVRASQKQVIDVATWGPKAWGHKGPALVNQWTHWGNQWGGPWAGAWGGPWAGGLGGAQGGPNEPESDGEGRGGWDNGANSINDGHGRHDG